MSDTRAVVSARAAGTFDIAGELTVNRVGFGAMRLTGDGIWGEPRDPDECRRVLRRAVEYQLHRVDPEVPLEASLGALIELRDGTASVAHLEENVGAAQIELSADEVRELEQPGGGGG
jgi:aryl-alcohol dehydrogenase-like predicted oxidoreductase